MRRRTSRICTALSALSVVALSGTAVAVQPHDTSGQLLPVSAGVVVAPTVIQPAAALLRAGSPAADLGQRISNALGASGATTVSAAVDVDGLGEVLRQDAAHALPPASTQKSFLGVAALLGLPPKARFTTEIAARTTPTAGRLPGSLWLVAGGDPYLTKTGLRALARSVRSAGITYATGDLLLDDSRYDAKRRVSGWKTAYVPEQSGPLSALVVDRNAWRRDSAFLSDPAVPITLLFREYLKAEGVTVHGVIRRHRRPVDARTVAATVSGPIADVLRRALKSSDNFASELVLKEVGKVVKGVGSSPAGSAAVMQLLGGQGVPVGAGTDGSGLSSLDRQTTSGQIALLRAAERGADAGVAFRRALPIACRDGTLEKRMCSSAASGRLSAKTGTLPGVRALAGYTTTASGRKAWFAFQLTGVRDGLAARNAIDRAAIELAAAPE